MVQSPHEPVDVSCPLVSVVGVTAPPSAARVQTRFWGRGEAGACRCHSLNLCSISRARSAPLRASSAARRYSLEWLDRRAASSSCTRAMSSSILARLAAVAAICLRSAAARWISSLGSGGWRARSRWLCATDLSISACSRASCASVRRSVASLRSRCSLVAASRARELSKASYVRLRRPSASVPSPRARSSSCPSRSLTFRSRPATRASRSSAIWSRSSAVCSRSSAVCSRSSAFCSRWLAALSRSPVSRRLA